MNVTIAVAAASIAAARVLLAQTLAEMEEYFEDRSEGWQEGERGDEHQERIAAMEAVIEAMNDLNF